MRRELVFWENVWRLFFNFNVHTQAQSHHESLQIFGVCTVSFGQEIFSNFCATVVIFQKKKTATSAVPKWELALWSNWKTCSFHDPQWSIAHRFPMVSIWSIDKFIDCVRRDYNYAVTLHVNSCLSQLIISRPDCYNLNPSRMKLSNSCTKCIQVKYAGTMWSLSHLGLLTVSCIYCDI